jgi:thiosulfate/3-mercaptopyruvate sulfurtransferase
MTDPLVAPAWLAERLGRPDVKVVDATWYMPGEAGSGAADYAAGHIPGAVFFDIEEVSDHATELPHMLPTPETFAKAAQRLGLTRDAEIVVYDARGIFSAPRVWWTLKTMGFPSVFVLDGGLKLWTAQNRPLETSPPASHGHPIAPLFISEHVCSLSQVREIVRSGSAQLVDARAAGRFRGEAPEPRPGLRSGHMPGACNLPWGELLNADGTMKPATALRDLFEAAGVDLAAPIVTTCGSGVSAALLALALARIGRDDVPVYDGSWTEWGGLSDTPVVTGP